MQHSTFCISITFHITPCLKLQLTFHIAPHLRSLHHISAHHSTSRPHSTAHHIKYKLHITLSHSTFQTTAHIPHCISTIIPHHTMFNWASNHSTSLGIPPSHFTSCITAAHHHIPYAPHHHSTSYHHISHLTLHAITSCITHSTLHPFPHHSHIRMNKAQHPTSGTAKPSTSHQIPHHTIPHLAV